MSSFFLLGSLGFVADNCMSDSYVDDLSVKKQDKALIHAKRARNIRTVLNDPKDTAVESAQFRYVVNFFIYISFIICGCSAN